MAYVPGFSYDLFVSYAHDDEGAEEWVTTLVDRLVRELRPKLAGVDGFQYFFDRPAMTANSQLEDLLAAASSSATFLAIKSPSYVGRAWTKEELKAFNAQAGNGQGRLFAAEREPLPADLNYPTPLDVHVGKRLWHRNESVSDTPRPLHHKINEERYRDCVLDLAHSIATKLRALRQKAEPGHAKHGSSSIHLPDGRTALRGVLLTQVTEDLDLQRQELFSYLEQARVPVRAVDNYPQGGEAFRKAFEADINRADIVVQLLSEVPGRRPPDLPEGYARAQFDLARTRDVTIRQWRRPGLQLDSVADLRHRELLSGADATTMEELKAEIRKLAISPPATRIRTSPGLVFINADVVDFDIADRLSEELCRHKFSVVLPATGGSSEEIRTDLEKQLNECEALILVYGKASLNWIRDHTTLFGKIGHRRAEKVRSIVEFVGPPPNKPPAQARLPGAVKIDAGEGVTEDSVRRVVEAVLAS